jgi:tetratricopeptide (TPR) repeat protein
VLGEVAFFRGEWIEAHRDALAAVSLYESLPESDSYSGYLITALHALAILEIEASWYADAEQHLRRALQLEERRNGAGYRDVTSSFVADLGAVLFLTGRFAEAEELLLAQLARCEASEGTGPIGPGKVLGALGELYFRWGRPEESVTYLERSLESFREHLPAEHRLIAERQYELGRSLHVAGSCAAAMGALAWILEHDTDQHLKAAALAVQAGCMAGRGQLAASAESYRLAYDAIQPFSSAGDLTRFDVLIEWMDVLVRLERFEEAERLLPRLYEDLRMCATRGDHIAEPHLSQLRAVAALLGQEDGVERKLIETGAKGKEVAAEDPRSGE